jgi:hypothetical protein
LCGDPLADRVHIGAARPAFSAAKLLDELRMIPLRLGDQPWVKGTVPVLRHDCRRRQHQRSGRQ